MSWGTFRKTKASTQASSLVLTRWAAQARLQLDPPRAHSQSQCVPCLQRPAWLPPQCGCIGKGGWALGHLKGKGQDRAAGPAPAQRARESVADRDLRQMMEEEVAHDGAGPSNVRRANERARGDQEIDAIPCELCGGTDDSEDAMVFCDGHKLEGLGLHSSKEAAWHSACLEQAGQASEPISEILESAEDVEWYCQDCCDALAGSEGSPVSDRYKPWKVLSQKSTGCQQLYKVKWQGTCETSWESFGSVSGTPMYREWRRKSRRGA